MYQDYVSGLRKWITCQDYVTYVATVTRGGLTLSRECRADLLVPGAN